MQKEEYLIKNVCYSPAKYYLCKQNNKRSLLGRKQRSQVVRSFLNRYQFSYTNKATCSFSINCILGIILVGNIACLRTTNDHKRILPKVLSIKLRVLLMTLFNDRSVSVSFFPLLALCIIPSINPWLVKQCKFFLLQYPLSASTLIPSGSSVFSIRSGSITVSEQLAGVVIRASTSP